MRFHHLAAVSGLCLAVLPAIARADDFTINYQTGGTISFSLPASPVPDVVVPNLGFTIDNVDVNVNGTQETENVLFYEDGIAIGQQVSIAPDPNLGYNVTAPGALINDFSVSNGPLPFTDPLYNYGGEAAPSFYLGTHYLESQVTGNIEATLTIAPDVATTPEPSSFLLLGTGLLGAAGILKRRFV